MSLVALQIHIHKSTVQFKVQEIPPYVYHKQQKFGQNLDRT